MRYKAGKVGRVVLARFDHGEQVVPALAGLCEKEGISSGWFFLFGAIRNGRLVAGPREASLPPDPVWQEFTEPFEIVGMGSIAAGGGSPSIHLHSSLGRGKEVLTGCIRKEGEVFIVVEAMVLEILGLHATRSPDERSGLELLTLA
jgi:predicted DNA-binding protein with PD1-like motif